MASDRKPETGPKTKEGKSQTRRNALRHGLNAILLRDDVSDRVARLAQFICADQGTKVDYQQALAIAEAQMHLVTVRRARVAAIEGTLSRPYHETIREIADLAVEAVNSGDIKHATQLLQEAAATIRKNMPENIKNMMVANTKVWKKAAQEAGASKEHIAEFRKARPLALPRNRTVQSADQVLGPEPLPIRYASLAGAKFDRYERRALSRRRRAIRQFIASSILAQS